MITYHWDAALDSLPRFVGTGYAAAIIRQRVAASRLRASARLPVVRAAWDGIGREMDRMTWWWPA